MADDMNMPMDPAGGTAGGELKCPEHPDMEFADQAALDAHMADPAMHPKTEETGGGTPGGGMPTEGPPADTGVGQ